MGTNRASLRMLIAIGWLAFAAVGGAANAGAQEPRTAS
jgi:hypothetical protein